MLNWACKNSETAETALPLLCRLAIPANDRIGAREGMAPSKYRRTI